MRFSHGLTISSVAVCCLASARSLGGRNLPLIPSKMDATQLLGCHSKCLIFAKDSYSR